MLTKNPAQELPPGVQERDTASGPIFKLTSQTQQPTAELEPFTAFN